MRKKYTLDDAIKAAKARGNYREEGFYRRILPPIPITNDELDRASPPQGYTSWDDFVNGKKKAE